MQKLTVLVTAAGAGSPLGCDIAHAFAARGCNIAVTGRNKGRVKQAAKEIAAKHGVETLPLILDLSLSGDECAAACTAAASSVTERFGSLDVLVNAAQAAKAGTPLQSCKASDLDLALNSGLRGAFFLMQAAYPHLKASEHGCVVNLLSAGAAAGVEGFGMLAASKEGLRGLSTVAANEWARDGISILTIEPQVRTAAFDAWAAEYPQAAQQLANDLHLETPAQFAERCVQEVLGQH